MLANMLPQKMKLNDEKESYKANDLARIAFQLKKLHLNDISEVFIYIENQLLDHYQQFLFIQPLFMLLQAFGQHGLHSQKLYTFTLGKLYQQT